MTRQPVASITTRRLRVFIKGITGQRRAIYNMSYFQRSLLRKACDCNFRNKKISAKYYIPELERAWKTIYSNIMVYMGLASCVHIGFISSTRLGTKFTDR